MMVHSEQQSTGSLDCEGSGLMRPMSRKTHKKLLQLLPSLCDTGTVI